MTHPVDVMAQVLSTRCNPSSGFRLDLPADYRQEFALRMWGRDPESLLETVRGSCIVKTLVHRGEHGTVTIELTRRTALCRVDGTLATSAEGMAFAHGAALRILGLQSDPAPFEHSLRSDPELAPLVAGREGLRIPQTATVFEAMIWAIAGQQVNLAFAYRLRRTLIELAGGSVGGGLRSHPTPEAIAALDYGDLTCRQFSRSKAAYLIDTARKIASGGLDVESLPLRHATDVHRDLLETRGIGEWTANYVMMRGCNFPDCVPAGDTGLTSGLRQFFGLDHRPDAKETVELMKRFSPYRSLATFHLWMQKGTPA